MDSDSDSDDAMDLAVLQKQADLMLNPANNQVFNVSQVHNADKDRLIQTEQFKPGMLASHARSVDASNAAVLKHRQNAFAGAKIDQQAKDD